MCLSNSLISRYNSVKYIENCPPISLHAEGPVVLGSLLLLACYVLSTVGETGAPGSVDRGSDQSEGAPPEVALQPLSYWGATATFRKLNNSLLSNYYVQGSG